MTHLSPLARRFLDTLAFGSPLTAQTVSSSRTRHPQRLKTLGGLLECEFNSLTLLQTCGRTLHVQFTLREADKDIVSKVTRPNPHSYRNTISYMHKARNLLLGLKYKTSGIISIVLLWNTIQAKRSRGSRFKEQKNWSHVDYCDVLSAVWTLILTAPIHCWDSLVSKWCNATFLKSFPMKKQTHLNLRWPEEEWISISRKCSFWVNYSFN